MALLLGIDTGGTYTDAVLMRDEEQVIATAKSLTTRENLALGIGRSVSRILAEAQAAPTDIALVSLSTTLATNALVQGRGEPVCLVFIGFGPRDISRQGLESALRGDPVISLAGGHSHSGSPVAPFDAEGLRAALAGLGSHISGFAVAAQFGTRNPEHERAARDIIREVTGAPVTCSHELSARLGGPKRAMTAVLNARLIGMIAGLINATQCLLDDLKITAPLMVVRGDGALISADLARERPIETILSGPAASIVGARWLTDAKDAIVSDIGGTTTDVAVLRDGRPMIDPDGAQVGGFRTMVEAVAMRTTGLGGDSEVHLKGSDLMLGPQRVMPVSLCAMDWPDPVHKALDTLLAGDVTGAFSGRFVVPMKLENTPLSARERVLVERMNGQVIEQDKLLTTRLEMTTLNGLVARGVVMISAITPSDASHVLGRQNSWDVAAASKAMALFSRRKTALGTRLAMDGAQLAEKIVAQLTEQTAQTLLETAFAEEADSFDLPVEGLARHVLTRRGLDHHRGLLAIDLALNLPLIGLGASAQNYYGAVGKRLNCAVILPEHGGVANAIGAVVGQISMRLTGQVTSPSDGCFRAHFTEAPQDFITAKAALAAMDAYLSNRAKQAALDSGAQGVHVQINHDIRRAKVESREVFIEAEITATASGRPRIS